MAARMIDTDTSPSSSMALCNPEHGGCGWRSPIYRTRAKALAAAERHRLDEHAPQATEAQAKRGARDQVAA